jgi:hypothetical protein
MLQLRDEMGFREWAVVGQRLARVASASAWALGDWLLFGQRRFSGRYRDAVALTDLDYQTLRNYAWVCRSFEPARRHERLSFQHHAELAALSEIEQDLWLARAEQGRWSRNELRRRLAAERSTGRAGARGSVVVRVELSPEHQRRWQRAAARTELDLSDWLRTVVDAAADAALTDERERAGLAA